MNDAPGKPGIPPTWCSSAKDMVTTALGSNQLWATLGYGILNEVFWPSTGRPQIRDLGFIVAKPDSWTEVKRLKNYTLSTPKPWIPLPTVVHQGPDFKLTLTIVPDDQRDVLLIHYNLEGTDYRLYSLLAPRLGTDGLGNSAWVDGGNQYARRDFVALCFMSDAGFARSSAGYVGRSDGWQDFHRNGEMTWTYPAAREGNVALMGELLDQQGVLALGLAPSARGAETLARSSLAEGFHCIYQRVHDGWEEWGCKLSCPLLTDRVQALAQQSATVLKVCEDRHYPGAVVASLSVPWGNSRDDLGGYHLVWARDSVQSGLAMLAAEHYEEARSMASYLIATQQPDGHWTQNFYPDGTPFWTGIQLDEVGFPILLLGKLKEMDRLQHLSHIGRLVRRAAGFLIRSGPVSPQDRWEENTGISAFTLAVQIAALVAAAQFLSDELEQEYVLSYADYLNRRIEDWLYVSGTRLSSKYEVDGYYLRLATTDIFTGNHGTMTIANRGGLKLPTVDVVSMDYLYLARLGLRKADDPRMANTLVVAEGELGVETPSGTSYHRYQEDGYGEHADGKPFDGTGIGRLWPLLTGERGHLAVQLGEEVKPYLEALADMAGPFGMLPEQIWDAAPIPEAGLLPGKPTGSAMPLLWAHAELIKLLAASATGQPTELLQVVVNRYNYERPEPKTWHWRCDVPFARLPAGADLVIESPEMFRLHFGFDGWKNTTEADCTAHVFGMYMHRLPRTLLTNRRTLEFTLFEKRSGKWEGQDHQILLG